MDHMTRAKEYAEYNTITMTRAKAFIKEFSGELKQLTGKIIDIGCGPGNVTHDVLLPHLAEDGVIVGADISRPMISHAQNEYKNEKRMSFIELDIQTNSLPPHLIGQFDNVFSFYCLHWCYEKELAMENIYKLLRPGGKGLVVIIANHPIFDILAQQQENSEYSAYVKDVVNWMPHYHKPINPEEVVRDDLKKAGFKVHHCTNRQQVGSWNKLDMLLDFFKTVNPFADKIPEALQQEYRDDMKRRLVENYLNVKEGGDFNNSVVSFKYSVVVAFFEK